MSDEVVPEDRRRLNRAVKYRKAGPGVYSTADDMHGIRRVAPKKWERGVRQPYHGSGPDWDFRSNPQHFKRLRDAQTTVEAEEAEVPRKARIRTQFNDRRGL